MNIKTIVNEARRGCGYRKKGGFYLVSGAPIKECGKLPLLLEVCPTCGEGIKPSRGWTWINAKALFNNKECKFKECDENCSLFNPPEKAGLLWVGEKFYPTTECFLNEAAIQGVSRRINHIPHDFKIGDWLFLAHRKAVRDTSDPDNRKCGIFYAYKPERIEYILKGDETEKELESMEHRDITLVKIERTDGEA